MHDFNIEKVVCIYAGRFQPFGPHHLKTYNWLKSKFDDVYISTTGYNKNFDNPFNFEQKVEHMVGMGIPSDKIVNCFPPFPAQEVLDKFDRYAKPYSL